MHPKALVYGGPQDKSSCAFPAGEEREVAAVVSTIPFFQNLSQKRHFFFQETTLGIYATAGDAFERFINMHLSLLLLLARAWLCAVCVDVTLKLRSPAPGFPAGYMCVMKSKGERVQRCCLLLPVREKGNFCTNCL